MLDFYLLKKIIIMKKNTFWNVLLFILKCTFIGFGGGNAIMPVIKRYAVEQNGWLTIKQFDDAVIAANMIPGPAVIEILSYVSIQILGKTKGILVTLLGIMPHVILTMLLFVGMTKLPIKYLYVINMGVIPAIIGILIAFGWRYIKMSQKELSMPLWISLFFFTFIFAIFVPNPFNIVAIPMIITILIVFTYEFIRTKRKKKKEKNDFS